MRKVPEYRALFVFLLGLSGAIALTNVTELTASLGAAGSGSHDYFDALVASPSVHVIRQGPLAGQRAAFSLRDQAQINVLSPVRDNPHVRYPPTDHEPQVQDAAQIIIKGDDHPSVIADPGQFMNGTPLKSDLHPLFYFDKPTGSNSYLVTWDVFYGDGWSAQIHDSDNPWHGMKSFRIVGKPTDGGGRATVFKVEVNFNPREGHPAIGHNWSKINKEFPIGDNVSRREPLSPNAWEDFYIRTGRWTRYWILFEENPGFATDTVTAWIADEERDPHLAIDHLQLELPWDEATGQGVQGIEMRISPKKGRRSGPTAYLYWRNLVVLKNPGNVDSLLVRPR